VKDLLPDKRSGSLNVSTVTFNNLMKNNNHFLLQIIYQGVMISIVEKRNEFKNNEFIIIADCEEEFFRC